MKISDVIMAGFPEASADTCEYILWNRTPFPMGKITARDVYKAASRVRRATLHGIYLCDMCDNKCSKGVFCCDRCRCALERAAA